MDLFCVGSVGRGPIMFGSFCLNGHGLSADQLEARVGMRVPLAFAAFQQISKGIIIHVSISSSQLEPYSPVIFPNMIFPT